VPVDWYLSLAQRCRSVLNIAARLHRGQPGELDDWETIDPRVAEWSDFTTGQGWKKVPYTKEARVEDEREVLGNLLDCWLDLTGTRIRVSWTSRSPEVGLAPSGVLGAVVTSLVFSVTRSGGLAVCSNCGRAYPPTRRPIAGRRRYCPDEQCQKARLRDAQADLRARRRREGQ
jgi:hypothetical protein